MTKGEKWKQFLAGKGWLKNGVISGLENERLTISVLTGGDSYGRKCATIDKALLLEDEDILCYECEGGTVFFQWDDIAQIRLEPEKKKKGWL